MKKLLFSLIGTSVLSIAVACGGGGSKDPVTPPPADPVPMAEGSATEPAAPTEPAEPAKTEPVAPAEPPAPDPAKIKADLLAAETAAFEKAKPVFEKHCARCHVKGQKGANKKKLDHFDMSAYPFKGDHANAKEVREVLGVGGGKITMPADKKGAVKGDDLAAITAWADAWDASHAGGAHEGHEGHH